jgi:AraC-like DNA-binding protein
LFAPRADEPASTAAHFDFSTVLRTIGRARGWRRRMEAGEFTTIQKLAGAVGLAERHVSRQLRLAYLAPEVLKRLTCGREVSAVSLYDLCFLAGVDWGEQLRRAACE